MSRVVFASLALLTSAIALAGPPADRGPRDRAGKSTVCHIPPGNPAAAHRIVVAPPAVQAHLDHGDHLGACTSGTPLVDDSPAAPQTVQAAEPRPKAATKAGDEPRGRKSGKKKKKKKRAQKRR